MITVGRTAAKLGILRIPGLYPLNSEALSAEERRQQKLLMYRNAVNIDYIREGEYVLNNAQLVGGWEYFLSDFNVFIQW